MREKLPNAWTTVSLGDLVDRLQYGFTASASNEFEEPKFLRITDIRGDMVDWNSVPGCAADEESIAKYLLRDGDIVFARSGSIEKAWRVTDVPRRAVFASYLTNSWHAAHARPRRVVTEVRQVAHIPSAGR